MQISQNFSQRMEQKLVMTRQMIQSIEMLQLPLMDLMQNINQELVANPWLEQKDGEVTDAGETGARESVEDRKQKEATSEADARVKRLETLMREWNDPNTRAATGTIRRAGEDDAKMEAMQNTAAPTISLEEHLLTQLHRSKESDRLKQLAAILVGSLDENGRLKVPI